MGLIIGINVLANTGHLYSGAKIRAMAEKNGLILTKGGGFAFYDDSRQVLFSLDSFAANFFASFGVSATNPFCIFTPKFFNISFA